MTITSDNLKFFESQYNSDELNGGGLITNKEVTDFETTEIFQPVAELSQIYGLVNYRKLFAKVDTETSEPLLGSYVFLAKPPSDENVNLFLQKASSAYDTVQKARFLAEAYYSKSTRLDLGLITPLEYGLKAATFMGFRKDILTTDTTIILEEGLLSEAVKIKEVSSFEKEIFVNGGYKTFFIYTVIFWQAIENKFSAVQESVVATNNLGSCAIYSVFAGANANFHTSEFLKADISVGSKSIPISSNRKSLAPVAESSNSVIRNYQSEALPSTEARLISAGGGLNYYSLPDWMYPNALLVNVSTPSNYLLDFKSSQLILGENPSLPGVFELKNGIFKKYFAHNESIYGIAKSTERASLNFSTIKVGEKGGVNFQTLINCEAKNVTIYWLQDGFLKEENSIFGKEVICNINSKSINLTFKQPVDANSVIVLKYSALEIEVLNAVGSSWFGGKEQIEKGKLQFDTFHPSSPNYNFFTNPHNMNVCKGIPTYNNQNPTGLANTVSQVSPFYKLTNDLQLEIQNAKHASSSAFILMDPILLRMISKRPRIYEYGPHRTWEEWSNKINFATNSKLESIKPSFIFNDSNATLVIEVEGNLELFAGNHFRKTLTNFKLSNAKAEISAFLNEIANSKSFEWKYANEDSINGTNAFLMYVDKNHSSEAYSNYDKYQIKNDTCFKFESSYDNAGSSAVNLKQVEGDFIPFLIPLNINKESFQVSFVDNEGSHVISFQNFNMKEQDFYTYSKGNVHFAIDFKNNLVVAINRNEDVNFQAFVESTTIGYTESYYSPIEKSLVNIDSTKLQVDGKVPVYKAGDVCVLYQARYFPIPSVGSGVKVSSGVSNVTELKVVDAKGLYMSETMYNENVITGEITFNSNVSTSGLSTPLRLEAIESEINVVSSSQPNQLILQNPVKREYKQEYNAVVGSALLLGEIKAGVTNSFSMTPWANYFEDTTTSVVSARYDFSNFPLEVVNSNSITERYAFVFTNSTNFNVIAEGGGVVASGSKDVDFELKNPVTQKTIFKVLKGGWGTGWQAGNALRVNIKGGCQGIWLIRSVQRAEQINTGSDKFCIILKGDATRG